MNTRNDQKERRREDILRAALDLFIRKGYAATKIKDIAEAVGMSVGLLFHYFDSKEALYEELIEMGLSGPSEVMAHSDGDPLEFFKMAAMQIFSYIEQDPFTAQMFVLMSHAHYNEGTPQKVKELVKDFDLYTPTARLIKQGQLDGTIKEGDPVALGIAYWCAIQGIAEQYAINPGYPLPESAWIVDIIRRG